MTVVSRSAFAFVLCWLLAGLFPVAQADDTGPVRLTYLFSDGNASATLAAWQQLRETWPELRGQVELQLITESLFDSLDAGAIRDSDVLVLDMMNQQLLERFDSRHGSDLIAEVADRGAVLAVGVGVQSPEYFTGLGARFSSRAHAYWQFGGAQNHRGLMLYALQQAGAPSGAVQTAALPEPEPGLEAGFYYPDGDEGRVFETWGSFDAWRREQGIAVDDRPQVAIGFYRAAYYSNETDIVDALIAEVERQGAAAVPMFGFPGHIAYHDLLLDDDGESRVDVILSLLLRFADFQATRVLAELDVPLLNMITLYGRSEQEWRESDTGLSIFEGTFQVAVPELAGLVAPTVIGSRERVRDELTGISMVVNQPVTSRIRMAVERGLAYASLRETDNADKRVALMYYNYPAGAANIGASYLNIAESLSQMLQRLQQEGYDVGDYALDTDSILADISTRARNVGGYAPGDLQQLAALGAERVPLAQYRQWLDALDPQLRNKILDDWGEPETADLMGLDVDDARVLLVPRVQYGNITLLPQPARAWGEDAHKLYHARDLAPHHQYVAAYKWLREVQQVDAVVHIGTHGTHEWLDGKDVGQTSADASDALIGVLPNIYIYNVDVVGEGLVARRRGMATLVDHMVPPFVESGLYAELAELSELVDDYHRNLYQNPVLAEAYAGQLIARLIGQGFDQSLDIALDPDNPASLSHDDVHVIEDFIVEMRETFIPFGLHAFGRLPDEEARESTVNAIVAADRSLLPEQQTVLAEDMHSRIVDSASLELDSLVRALEGRYIGGGPGGEPIRNPDVYPTGKNFYGIDPSKVPKPAAWELGVRLADEMLEQHLADHGEYPRKISFVIWGDETMRHEGILESQIFHLLGTRPVWNERGTVVDVEVIPSQQLGRPRVDIVIASASQGMFTDLTMLMDKAVQQVKALEEAENFVRDHYLQTRAALMDMGYSEEDADRRASVRIFDEPPGSYNLNTANIAADSGSWDSDLGMAHEYINKMGHGYGNGFWGEPMHDTFRLALEGVEKVVHSSSTMLYGALDNDDFFMYMGGLAAAVRAVDGQTPEMVVTNTRNPSRPEMTPIERFIGGEMRTRYVNPRWIEGMQSEGYAGARAMAEFVEYMWGWNATVPDVIDDFMWQETFEVYVQDRHQLDMEAFFDQSSPYAFQDMVARMLETVRKEYWQPDDTVVQEMLTAYVESIQRHGIGCTEVSCGNPRLMEYIIDEGAARGVDGVALDNFQQLLEAVVQNSIRELAASQRAFAESNDALIEQLFAGVTLDSPGLEGFRMDPVTPESSARSPALSPAAVSDNLTRSLAVLFQALLLVALAYWWWRRRWRARHS